MLSKLCFFLVFVALGQSQNAPANIPPPPPQGRALAVAPSSQNSVCSRRNGYFKVEGSCDAYIECREFQAGKMMCPDGLHFNPDAQWPAYPCGYPEDVPCLNRGAAQPAQPTAQCPHQYGFFLSSRASSSVCQYYKMCVAGVAIEMKCPPGLAFNPAIGRCDWPDLVSSCDEDAFLGFKCPAPPLDANGHPINTVQNYEYKGTYKTDCYYFFTCEQGRARLLSCDYGLAFDPASGRCVDEDLVKCPQAQPLLMAAAPAPAQAPPAAKTA